MAFVALTRRTEMMTVLAHHELIPDRGFSILSRGELTEAGRCWQLELRAHQLDGTIIPAKSATMAASLLAPLAYISVLVIGMLLFSRYQRSRTKGKSFGPSPSVGMLHACR